MGFRMLPSNLVGMLSLSLFFTGCGNPDPTSYSPPPESKLLRLYLKYAQSHRDNRGIPTGPANEAEFKRFLRSIPAQQLAEVQSHPGEIDQLFISPRDGQPYRLVYGLRIDARPGVVLYESTGVDGKKRVYFLSGKSEEMDDAQLQQTLAVR